MFSGLVMLLMLAPAQAAETAAARPLELREERVKPLEKTAFSGMSALTIRAELKGPAVKQAAKYGNLKVSDARDDGGTDLFLKDDPFFGTNYPDMKLVDDFSRKEDRLGFSIRLKTAPRTAKKLSVKGSLDLLVAGTRVNADFPKVRSLSGSELKHPELEALKVKIKITKVEKTLDYVLEGSDSLIEEIVLLDKAGKKINTAGTGSFSFGKGSKAYQLHFAQPIDATATLRVTVLKGARVVTVPFVFSNLELP